MIALTIAQIARAVSGRVHLAGDDTDETVVDGLVDTDSRLITPGDVFVAKPGEETDGHLFVGAAVDRGAVLAIVERRVDADVSQIVVADVVVAIADLARAVVAQVRAGGDLRVVGITGSNGKTTTKNLLARIMEGEGETVSPRASFNNEVGAPLTMLRVTDSTRYLVSEFGASAPGEIARLAGLVDPDVGVVLMVFVLQMVWLIQGLRSCSQARSAWAQYQAQYWQYQQQQMYAQQAGYGYAQPQQQPPQASPPSQV